MRIVVLTVAVVLGVIGLSLAQDVHALATKQRTDIPAQGLGPALQILAKQRKFQLVYVTEELKSLRTNGAKGEFTPDEALARLLSDTGYTYRYLDEKTVTIISASTAGTDSSPRSSADAVETTPKEVKSSSGWFRLAQVDQGKTSGTGSGNGPLDKPAARGSDGNSALDEIVVTAQKRDERLKNVPISISVLTGKELDQATEGISDALSRVPGVSIAYGAQGGATQVTVRGVTAGNANFQGSSAVGYYLDSAPFGFVKAAMAPDPDAYDLQRVEVLRGPQGTLYGASSLNGVVRVLTQDADLNHVDFKTRESGSATDSGGGNYRADMAVNVPIIEGVLAARAVVGYQSWSGWIDTPNALNTNGAVERTERLKINASPTENLSIAFSAWDTRNNYGATNMANDQGFRDTTGREPISTDYDVYSLKVSYDFSAFSLSSMSSYLSYVDWGVLDLAEGGVPVSLYSQFDSRMMSQEFVLNSRLDGPWRWSAGASYRDDKDLRYQVLPVLLPAPENITDRSRSEAVYGELTRLFLDGRFEVTGGLRYFEDRVEAKENTPLSGIPNSALHDGNGVFVRTTPRVVLTWHASDALTSYVSYSEGFRSGFPQDPSVLAIVPNFPSLKADKLDNYEIGVKSSLWNGRVDWEAAAYYIKWQDVQQALGIPIGGNVDQIALINAGNASGPGIDLSINSRPVDGLDVGFNFNWNKLEFDQAIYSSGVLYAASGDRLSYSPEFTVGAHVGYSFGLGFAQLTGHLTFADNYTSKQVFRYDAGGGAIVREPGDDISIARAAFSVDASTQWSVTVFADNINNESGAYVRRIYGFGEDWSSRPRPRTIGLQFDYHLRRQ